MCLLIGQIGDVNLAMRFFENVTFYTVEKGTNLRDFLFDGLKILKTFFFLIIENLKDLQHVVL